MESIIRTGVSLPKDVIELIDKYLRLAGGKSRSKVLTMAVKSFVSERLNLEGLNEILGTLIVVYNEARGDTVKRFIDVQHHFVDEIIATLHIHATHNKCVEVIMVKGAPKRILELVGKIESIVGVEYTRLVTIQL